jgi:osmotically-inducible protein OsmY
MLKRHLQRAKILVCLGLVTTFMGCEATSNTSSTGQKLDDTVITTKAKAAIFAEPDLKTLQIDIKTFKGVVQLSGFVDSTQSAKKAGDVVGSVPGIAEVKNDLVVK